MLYHERNLEAANKLLLEGSLVFADIEREGIRIDVDYLDKIIVRSERKIRHLQSKLESGEIFKVWKKEFKNQMNLGSRDQLGRIIFDKLGHLSPGYTSGSENKQKKRHKTTKSDLMKINLPFVNSWLNIEKLKKVRSTFLEGIRREAVDGFIHPVFNLHLVETYRSSCDSPNVQNWPVRDQRTGSIARRCLIPREGNILVEIDYKALEFKIAACVWKDPKMIRYASDPKLDIHRDMAAECYKVRKREVNGQLRYCGKNGFVFPRLYGSFYAQIAKNMWGMIDEKKLIIERDGEKIPLKDHLQAEGIEELGDCDWSLPPRPDTFENHIMGVERKFDRMFPTWCAKKEERWAEYRCTGSFQVLTGFRIAGLYTRNFIMNAPIQSVAFHCLLWSLIRLHKELKKRGMKAKIIAEIHDSILADVPVGELQEYLTLAKRVMTVDLPEEWDWIVVPLEVEAEVAEKNWHGKTAWREVNGTWVSSL